MITPEEINKYKIGIDEPFHFKCRACGKCCKNRDDIILTPFDLFRIAKHLNMETIDVIRKYCDFYEGHDSLMPIIKLQSVGKTGQCPLLRDKKCTVHPVKPVKCALYPLGRGQIGDASEVIYILQPANCGSFSKTYTPRKWLERFGIPVDDHFFLAWNAVVKGMSTALRELRDAGLDKERRLLFLATAEKTYRGYDMDKDFLPQFMAHAQELQQMAEDVKSMLKEAK